MIYCQLFYEFIKIGLFSFGGAYGAIPLIQETVLKRQWMDSMMFSNLIAISESTPGPIMVNTATYIGYIQGGILGAACATLGVILPSFCVILLIAMVLKKWMQGNTAQGILKGINPCIMGIILATGTYMLGQVLFMKQQFQMTSFLIYVILTVILTGYKKMKKKELSPIMLIVISAVLGIVLYEWF